MGPPPGADLRQELPAHLRRRARARRQAPHRGVQAAPRAPQRRRAAADRPARPARAPAPRRAAASRAGGWWPSSSSGCWWRCGSSATATATTAPRRAARRRPRRASRRRTSPSKETSTKKKAKKKAKAKPKVARLTIVATGQVYVCLKAAGKRTPVPGIVLTGGARQGPVQVLALPPAARDLRGAADRQRQVAQRPVRWPTASATRSRRARCAACPPRNGRAARPRERAGGHRRDGHRGPHGPRDRPQRAVAVRAPARGSASTTPTRWSSATAARTWSEALRFLAARGVDVDRHQRRAGADRRRPDRRGRGRVRRARPMVLDEALEERIAEILRPLLSRWPDLDPDAIRASNRKQAVVPEGATVLEPVGTAPGLVVPVDGGPTVVVLPGPPRELHAMWPAAVATDGLPRGRRRARSSCARRCCGCSGSPSRRSPRRCGWPRTPTASTGLEITTCLRRGEVEVVTRFSPAAAPRLRALRGDRPRAPRRHAVLRRRAHGRPAGGRPAALARASRSPRPSRAPAGCWPARLTELAGSSDYVLGGLVVYSNEAKAALAGVDPALIERVGRGVARGRRGAGRRRAGAAGRRRRRRDHGRGRARAEGRPRQAGRASCAFSVAGPDGAR